MYQRYWNFHRRPFDDNGLAPLPFPGRSHEGGLLKLRYLVDEGKGIAVVVGEHGVGKTYLLRVFESETDPKQAGPFARLLVPQLSPAGMLAYLASKLGVPAEDSPADHVVLDRLERALAEQAAGGAHPILVVDDAHLLDAPHLNLLRLLLNLREAGAARFSIILCGRPELLGRMESLPGLDQRLVVRAALEPLGEDEVGGYVTHRLQSAGGKGTEFDPAAVRRIWQLSQGIPRRINQLADLSLLVGYADHLRCIGAVEVNAAAEELLSITIPSAA